jgi:hypothetical protein
MSLSFWKKEILSNSYFIDGVPVHFDALASDTGILATDDPKLISGLEDAASKRKGGIVKITQAEYDGLKKNRESNPFKPASRQEIRLFQSPSNLANRAGVIKPLDASLKPKRNQLIATANGMPAPTDPRTFTPPLNGTNGHGEGKPDEHGAVKPATGKKPAKKIAVPEDV